MKRELLQMRDRSRSRLVLTTATRVLSSSDLWARFCIASGRSTVCLLAVFFASSVFSAGLVDEPDDYRMENYDDVVPDTLKGATVVEAEQVQALRDDENAVIVDVIPAQRPPDYLPEGQLWIPVPHMGVPGSIWLPDTGYGVLSEVTENYFLNHLAAATDNDKTRALAFYCRDNCWMSWNAAKRALEHGYTRVYWFTEGTEGWFDAGFEFEALKPAPGERQ